MVGAMLRNNFAVLFRFRFCAQLRGVLRLLHAQEDDNWHTNALAHGFVHLNLQRSLPTGL